MGIARRDAIYIKNEFMLVWLSLFYACKGFRILRISAPARQMDMDNGYAVFVVKQNINLSNVQENYYSSCPLC